MSAQGESEGGEKSHEPTQKRLQDARKKGDIARSTDISTAAIYLGFILSLILFGKDMRQNLGAGLSYFLSRPETISQVLFAPGGQVVLGSALVKIVTQSAPMFILPALFVLLAVLAQRAFVFAPTKIAPKLSRISPISALKNKFGLNGLFEFAKSLVKLMIVSIGAGVFFQQNLDTMVGSIRGEATAVIGLIGEKLVGFLWFVLALSVAIAGLDYLWQVFAQRRKLMMTRKEVTDEAKESEGDPHLKQTRRQRGMDIATGQMISDVPGADVVIVNPEHYAVALKWNRDSAAAPICIAKGVDEIAARIREVANRAGVPIHRDPPTARAIFADVDVGDEIHADHYKAVAAAIRYAEKIRNLRGARRV